MANARMMAEINSVREMPYEVVAVVAGVVGVAGVVVVAVVVVEEGGRAGR